MKTGQCQMQVQHFTKTDLPSLCMQHTYQLNPINKFLPQNQNIRPEVSFMNLNLEEWKLAILRSYLIKPDDESSFALCNPCSSESCLSVRQKKCQYCMDFTSTDYEQNKEQKPKLFSTFAIITSQSFSPNQDNIHTYDT